MGGSQMNGFFIGARVRIKACEVPELVGQEGRIVAAAGAQSNVRYTNDNHWHVAPDAWGTDQVPPRVLIKCGMNPFLKSYYIPSQQDLEPILPEGHRASEMSFKELMDACTKQVEKVD